jgi:DNA polymerase-1
MDRSKSKMINYGIVYGLSDYGLADRLNITREEAQGLHRRLPRALPARATPS